MFTTADARWLGETIGGLYRARTARELVRSAMDDLDRRWPLVATAFEEFNLAGTLYIPHDLRVRGPLATDMAACIHDNPLLSQLQAGRLSPVMHIGSMVSRAAWERTDHYNGIARVTGYEDQAAMFLQSAGNLVTVSVYPDQVFADSVPVLLGLIQPHLQAAWARVQDRPVAEPGSDSPRVLLSDRLRPLSLTAAQHTLLRAYFPRWSARGDLPEALHAWLRGRAHPISVGGSAAPLTAYTVRSRRGQLGIRYFAATDTAPAELRLMESPVSRLHGPTRHALTAREREILAWLAQGKRDGEIASILGVAPATVSKHVENLLRKLHVETRAAADL